MFELRHLRVFREVSRRGSLSAAAESLDYTQPAVSQQMAALERRAMMPLLDRTTRGVRLTEAGEALLRHAEAILSEQTLAEQELEALAAVHGGRVRMASFPTAGAALVPPAVSQFIARYPDVELSVLEAEPQEAVSMLRAGELELALVAERKRPDAFGDAYEESSSTTSSMSRCACFFPRATRSLAAGPPPGGRREGSMDRAQPEPRRGARARLPRPGRGD